MNDDESEDQETLSDQLQSAKREAEMYKDLYKDQQEENKKLWELVNAQDKLMREWIRRR